MIYFVKTLFKKTENGRSKILIRILGSIIGIILVSLLVFSVSLYLNFRSIALSLIYHSEIDSLNQVSYSSTFMTETAKALSLQVYFDQTIQPLFTENPDGQDVVKALKLLKTYESSAPFVNSIYVYNGHTGLIYATKDLGVYNINSFFDKDLLSMTNNFTKYEVMKPIPRQISVSDTGVQNENPTNVYTYMFSFGGLSDKVIIINISVDWMGDVVKTLDLNNINEMYIIDNSGTIVLDTGMKNFLTDASNSAYFKKILESKSPTGYFSDNVNGQMSLVIYASSSDLPWKFVRIVPESRIFTRITNIRNTTIVISSILLLVIVLLLIFTSRIAYKPVDAILDDLAKLKSEKTESQNMLKQKYLYELILGEITDEQSHSSIGTIDIKLDFDQKMMILLLKIDNYSDVSRQFSAKDKSLLMYGIVHSALINLNKYPQHEIVDMHDGKIIAVFNINPDDTDDQLRSVIRNIQDSVQDTIKLTVSAIYAIRNDSDATLPLFYGKIMNAAVYKLFLGNGCVISVNDLIDQQSREFVLSLNAEKEFTNALMSHDYDELDTIYDKIIEKAAASSYSSFYITIMKLAIDVCNTTNAISESFDMPRNYDINTLVTKLNREETLDGINRSFKDIFIELDDSFSKKQNKKHEAVISKVIQMIHSNYQDCSLTIYTLAQAADMSPGYLGRLFRKITSTVVSDYINNVRIEKAKELLLKTSLSVNEIVEKVGFSNSNYFYPLFKKMTGFTPNDFRRSERKN